MMTSTDQVRLVARREIIMGARGRMFLLGNVAVVILVVVGLIVLHYFVDDKGADREASATVGVVALTGDEGPSARLRQVAEDAGIEVQVRPLADEASARSAVAAGDVPGVIVYQGGDQARVLLADTASSTVRALATAAASRSNTVPQVQVSTIPVQTGSEDSARYAIALAAMVLLLLALTIGGSMIASGVAGEKETRIVELLLATIPPRVLLTGKILGIGLLTIGQIALYGGTALLTALLLGDVEFDSSVAGVGAVALAALVIGFFFFASLYAAAGALVSRQEDVQSVAFPITALGMIVFYVAVFAGGSQATWVQVLAVIPPFSIGIEPFRTAYGHASFLELLLATVLLLAATAGVIVAGARVYERGVLNVGPRLSWREALRR